MRTEFQIDIPRITNPSGDVYTTGLRANGLKFCLKTFLAVTGLPEGTRRCYIVATKRLSKYSYRITQARGAGIWHPRGARISNLTDIKRNYLYTQTRFVLGRLYDAGYRGVHVEVDV